MDNITPEEVMQMEIDRVKSEQPKHDFRKEYEKHEFIDN